MIPETTVLIGAVHRIRNEDPVPRLPAEGRGHLFDCEEGADFEIFFFRKDLCITENEVVQRITKGTGRRLKTEAAMKVFYPYGFFSRLKRKNTLTGLNGTLRVSQRSKKPFGAMR